MQNAALAMLVLGSLQLVILAALLSTAARIKSDRPRIKDAPLTFWLEEKRARLMRAPVRTRD